jgi:hypothetical protein
MRVSNGPSEETDMKSSSARQAVYSTATHRAMRWAWGSFLALLLIGLIEVAARVISKAVAAADWRALSGLWALAPVLVVWLGLARFFFRQQPIWGSADGLEVGSGRRSRLIPWSKVGPPEWAWFSFDVPGSLRIAYVQITDEGRIFLYADDDSLEKLSLLRSEALASGRTKAKAAPGDAERADRLRPERPAFPLAFIPLVLVLVAVVNIVMMLVQTAHAVLAVTLLVITVVITALVFAFRKPSNG